VFRRTLTALSSPSLLNLIALAGLVGWATAFIVHLPSLRSLVDKSGDAIGGDFIAFYTAGRLIGEGQGGRLYDLQLQQVTQRKILDRPDYAGLNSYVNPPALAAFLVPLGWLPYLPAYLLYTLLLLCAFLAGMHVLRPHLAALRHHWFVVVVLSLLFYPIVVAVTGGQNTPITLLLIAAAYTALRRGRAVLAGLALGLLCYKPQMALLLCLLLLFRGQIRCVLTAGVVGIGHYLVGAVVCGVRWPVAMLDALRVYWPIEDHFNGANSISLLGLCDYALPGSVFMPVGLVAAGLTFAAVLWTWRRADPRGDAFALYWGVAVCATLAVSPHTQWYDVGLVVLAMLLALNHLLTSGEPIGTGLRAGLLLGFLAVPAYPIAAQLGWQPLAFVPLLMLLWLLQVIRREGQPAPDAEVQRYGLAAGT
jgi:hypothetical protein